MSNKVKALLVIALLVVGGGATGYAVLGLGATQTPAVTFRTAQATNTTVERTAAASGSLVAADTYELAFGATPVLADDVSSSSSTDAATSSTTSSATTTSSADVVWLVEAITVAVGDVVEAGDALATADDSSARLTLDQAQADLEAAYEQLANDQAGSDANALASAQDAVTQAEANLADAKAGNSNTLAQSRLSLKQAKRSLADARSQLADDRDDDASDEVIEQDKDAVRQASDALASTKLQIENNNRQAGSQVTSAEQSLATAKRNYTTATTPADSATLVADQIAIAAAQTAVDDAQTALDAATITAPIDGRVTVINAVVGQDSTGTAIELQSTRLAVTVSVGESDILDLAVGQSATVEITATDETVNGTVSSIDPIAATSGASTTVTYSVTVLVADEDAASSVATMALPGMSAEVSIVTARADNAVAVPAIALSGTDGNYSVRVLSADGSVATRAVQVGLVTSDLAEIKSGVAVGESVVTGSSSDRVTTSGTGNGGGGFVPGGGGFQPPPGGGFPGQ